MCVTGEGSRQGEMPAMATDDRQGVVDNPRSDGAQLRHKTTFDATAGGGEI